MRKLVIIFCAVCLSSSYAQMHSVSVYGSYLTALAKRQGFMKVTGFGGGASARYLVAQNIGVNLSFGYGRYGSIEQDSSLIKWNWKFWNERYGGNVRIDTLSDTLKAVLNPTQYMEVLPLLLTASYEFQPFEKFFVRPSIGGGILFYTRSLYMDEEWKKRFASLNYTFEYDFRNFAPDKKGNPFALVGGLELSYQVSDPLAVTAQSHFTSVVKTTGKYGYDDFPMKSSLAVSLGLSFLY
ncbi:MAG: hypothetical protein HY961_21490 [Ignavibacteriae bacterium]|nr:hypothetical protein [Ignavibacteriota bacterium]